MAGRMAMSACFGWEPIVARQYAVQNCVECGGGTESVRSLCRRSRPRSRREIAALGILRGAGGNDDAELAKPQNVGYELMQSRNREEERGVR